MKVLLNIDPIRYPLTCIGRYTYELALALRRSGRLEDLLFWDGRRAVDVAELPFFNAETGGQLPIPRAAWREFLVRNLIQYPWVVRTCRSLKNWRVSRRMRSVNNYDGYVYHDTGHQLPDFRGIKVVTFSDLSAFHFPDCHPRGRVLALRESMELACDRADAIVTISAFSKRCIVEHFEYPEERIFVTSLAASGDFRPMNRDEATPVLERRRLWFKRYSLFVGTVEPRKNLDFLLDVYENLPAGLRDEFPLVVCGDEGWQSERTHTRLRAAETQGWARYFNFVPQEELPFLMAGAAAFLFPSLYEGFGLPPLEAMQSGVPVVTSNRASLPEVVGDAGVLLDPGDSDAWHEAIRERLENPNGQGERVHRGLARAALFSWDRCATETVAAYKAVFAC